MGDKRDFFVSYTGKDEHWAIWIAGTLESAGYSCYIQAWDFRPGGNFELYMHTALQDSVRFIAVASEDYLKSKQCTSEWTAAFAKDPDGEKKLNIFVRITDVVLDGLFAPKIYINLFDKTDEDEIEKVLLQGLDPAPVARIRPALPNAKKPRVRFPGSLPATHNISDRRNDCFTGRDDTLEAICAGFDSGDTISLTQSITGLGGLGKTQTALEYVYRYAYKYDCIWWVGADTDTNVMTAYRAFAYKKCPAVQAEDNDERITDAVLDWLNQNSKWLFVYDNADKVAGNTRWLPKNQNGHILITTRNRQDYIGKKLDIELFTEPEAVTFLARRTELDGGEDVSLKLAKRLGCFPLALEQAAAYIKTNQGSYKKYLDLLEKYGLAPLEKTKGVIGYELSVAATWQISIDKILEEDNGEAAQQLLNLCAYFAPEGIAPVMFGENAELLPSPLKEALSNDMDSDEVWSALTKYSLLEKDDSQNYSMHRLLQEVVRNNLHGDQTWALCCLEILHKNYKFDYDKLEQFSYYLPHVTAFAANVKLIFTNLSDKARKMIGWLYSESGFGNNQLGNYDQALKWLEKARKITEELFGKEHSKTAITYNNIAVLYKYQGKYDMALELYNKTLAIYKKVLDADNPSIAATYDNIAQVYYSKREYPTALEWFNKALAIRETLLGAGHPDTAITYANIAAVYADLDDYDKALEWNYKALAIFEEKLGAEHPDTATTYANIANVYFSQGEYAKALPLLEKAWQIREKKLGMEHPYTKDAQEAITFIKAEMQ